MPQSSAWIQTPGVLPLCTCQSALHGKMGSAEVVMSGSDLLACCIAPCSVLAAAERLVLPHRLGAAGGLPLKSSLQNALAKRSLGSSGGSQEQQPGRRKLLSVSTSYVVGADSLPSGSLFGFKKLSTGKPN